MAGSRPMIRRLEQGGDALEAAIARNVFPGWTGRRRHG